MVQLYSTEHTQTRAMIERALAPLWAVLRETPTLSIGFQFNQVLLNSLPLTDPTLSPLAGELVKRRVAFLVFSEGIDEAGLARMLTVLATRPEDIEEKGGLVRFLRAHPLENAHIVPLQVAAADGSMAVVTSAEEAAAMAKVPRWLQRALEEIQAHGGGHVVDASDLESLAQALSPELTPEQRVLLPQMQELLTRVVQRASSAALSELLRAAMTDLGGAGEELLQSVVVQGLIASAQAGELPQAERILRSAPELHLEPESLANMIPVDRAGDETRQGLLDYAAWLRRPIEDRLGELSGTETGREFRWLVLEIEQALHEGRADEAARHLLVVFAASGPAQENERAEAMTRARYLLAEVTTGQLPANAAGLLEAISTRIREENSALVSTPLVEALVVLTQAAADREDFTLATNGAGVIGEIGEEFSPRGRTARQALSRLLKPSTLKRLVNACITRKNDPVVSRSILPLLKRVGDQAARELLALLEREPMAARRLRTLQVIKLLGKSASDALAEKLNDPHWYVVRNAVVAMAELADPALLERLEPALSHPDPRVQQAAVSAALKTQSPTRGVSLARALPHLKPAVLETVLDDLLVLKEPSAVPYLERLVRHPAPDVRAHLLQKAIAALWAVGAEDAVYALVDCAEDSSLALPLREAAVRALARMELPAARRALEDFAAATTEASLAAEARKFLSS